MSVVVHRTVVPCERTALVSSPLTQCNELCIVTSVNKGKNNKLWSALENALNEL